MSTRTDAIITAAITHAPTIGAACLAVGILGAVAVVVLDEAERRIVERSHVPLKGEA